MLQVAGAALQVGSSLMEGFVGARQKKDEAAINSYNAEVLRQRAESVRKRTKFRQTRQAEEAARIQGNLEASIGGSGLVSTEGAPMMALALQKSELDLESFLIGMEGRMEAEELESSALGYDMAAKMAKKGAKQSIIGGFLGAGASAISAYSRIPKTQGVTWGATKMAMDDPYYYSR